MIFGKPYPVYTDCLSLLSRAFLNMQKELFVYTQQISRESILRDFSYIQDLVQYFNRLSVIETISFIVSNFEMLLLSMIMQVEV